MENNLFFEESMQRVCSGGQIIFPLLKNAIKKKKFDVFFFNL